MSEKHLNGQITRWNDDRGFGFIAPHAGGDDIFVHISAFADRNRRPEINDRVVYQTGTDKRGRTQATRARFAQEMPNRPGARISAVAYAVGLATAFLAIVAILVAAGKLPLAMLGLYVGVSMASIMVYAWDKSAARKSQWRTAENTLHLLALLGGWPGALIARHLFRHKSKKQPFIILFWVTVILNCLALGWLLTPEGHNFLLSALDTLSRELGRL